MAKEARGAVLTLRITEAEQEHLRQVAQDNDLTVSEYVRSMVRGDVSAGADRGVAAEEISMYTGTASQPVSATGHIDAVSTVAWHGGTNAGTTFTLYGGDD